MKNSNISHRERMETCLSGKKPDRTPIALWRHFPVDDQTSDGLARAVGLFQNTYDFDFIKITPASSYCLIDWGSKDVWRGNPEGTREYLDPVIQRYDDWRKLPSISPRKGMLSQTLECIRLVAGAFSSHTPVIQTIFSPLAQAKNLVGKDRLTYHLRTCPEAVHFGLQKITETTIEFILEAKKIGIDGIFFAVQHAQYDVLSQNEFETFGRFYDLKVLDAVNDLWLNLAHMHGTNLMLDSVIDYPVAILNWHDQHTPPTLVEAKHKFPGIVCGGLKQWETMVLGTPDQVKNEAFMAIQESEGIRTVLGTGCVLPITAPHGNILAAREAVDERVL